MARWQQGTLRLPFSTEGLAGSPDISLATSCPLTFLDQSLADGDGIAMTGLYQLQS